MLPPRDSQLSQVLERGSGGAAALAILYMEVHFLRFHAGIDDMQP